jgi:hypothetical protein
MLGARQQDMGCAVREVRRETRSLKGRERKRPSTSSIASKAKAKRRLSRRESFPRPKKTMRPKNSTMEMESSSRASGKAVKESFAQMPAQPQKRANVGNARGQARASITAF